MNKNFDTFQYVKSKNCTMEFEFATVTLKLPVILCVVGTGHQWIASTVSTRKVLLNVYCFLFFNFIGLSY